MMLPMLFPPALPVNIHPNNILKSFLTDVVDFKGWIANVGGLVAFIGAVYLAKAVRSEDQKEGIQAALTMVAGFMIKDAVTNMTIFTVSGNAANEFSKLTKFASGWVAKAGMVGMFLGAIQFGYAIKNNDAAAKVTALSGMVAGAVVVAVAGSISLFV